MTYGANLAAAHSQYGSLQSSDHWIDQMVFAWHMDKAASKDMLDHKGGDWPNHPAFSHRQGFGVLLAARWKTHEPYLRHIMGAGPARNYVDAKGYYDPTIDPCQSGSQWGGGNRCCSNRRS